MVSHSSSQPLSTPSSQTKPLPIAVWPTVGHDGQPQWTLQLSLPLSTHAVAALCKAITQQGGVIRAIAFVATAPSSSNTAMPVELSPQLQLNVQGPTLATAVLQETLMAVLDDHS